MGTQANPDLCFGGGFGGLVYAQFNYLLPLNMETLYGAKGAAIFGMLTSTNALVVIIATPIITTFAEE